MTDDTMNLQGRKEYGGLKTDQAWRMKDLEKENLRLRRAISDLTLDKLILQEAALYRPGERGAGRIRAAGVPRARAAPVDTAQGAVRGR